MILLPKVSPHPTSSSNDIKFTLYRTDFDPEGHQALQNEPHDSESDVDGGDDDRETRIHYAEVGYVVFVHEYKSH